MATKTACTARRALLCLQRNRVKHIYIERERERERMEQEKKEKEKKKVMVAIDESESSHYSLTWALENLADTLRNSELLVFTVQPTNSDFAYTYASSFGAAPPELIESILANHKKFALALLDKAKDICANHGIVAEAVTEVGDPKEAICEAVEKHNIKLLVLGSHGRGAVKRAFLGSVSNSCVHNAKCPVLVVRKQE